MMAVAAMGLVVNLISMRILSSGKDCSLNMKGAYLEVWSDMLGSIGVIAAALIIKFSGWAWIDALVAVGIGLWVLPRTWQLLKESTNILLEGVPDGVDVAAVSHLIVSTPGVVSVHDLHIWALTSGKTSLTAHVVHDETTVTDATIAAIKIKLADQFKVFHTTLQFEIKPCKHTEDG